MFRWIDEWVVNFDNSSDLSKIAKKARKGRKLVFNPRVQSWNGFRTVDIPTLIHRHDKGTFLTRVGLKSDPSLVYCMIKIQIEIEGLLVVKRERGGGRE